MSLKGNAGHHVSPLGLGSDFGWKFQGRFLWRIDLWTKMRRKMVFCQARWGTWQMDSRMVLIIPDSWCLCPWVWVGPGTFSYWSIEPKQCDVFSVILLRKTVTSVLLVDPLLCCLGLHAQMKEIFQSVSGDGELRAASSQLPARNRGSQTNSSWEAESYKKPRELGSVFFPWWAFRWELSPKVFGCNFVGDPKTEDPVKPDPDPWPTETGR